MRTEIEDIELRARENGDWATSAHRRDGGAQNLEVRIRRARGATPVHDAAVGTVKASAKIPITTASAYAKTLYPQGRTLVDQLRLHDGRALFEQAVAKDSTARVVRFAASGRGYGRDGDKR